MTTNPCSPIEFSAAELLPHAGKMRLITQLLEQEADRVSSLTHLNLQDHALFVHQGKIGSWLLIELMAQTVGLYAGLKNKSIGNPPKIGFLLGTRRFTTSLASLAPETDVTTVATCVFFSTDELPSQFHCECFVQGQSIAEANLTVYQPTTLDPWKN